jgi:hypothetical protein
VRGVIARHVQLDRAGGAAPLDERRVVVDAEPRKSR